MKEKDNKGFWDRWAKRYDFVMSKDGKTYAQIVDRMKKVLDREMTVLELACGTGLLSVQLAGSVKLLEATDFSEEMIRKAKAKEHSSRLHFSVQDATRLPYAQGTFDAVVISNALHIMPEPEKALAEIRRVLKPGGILIAPTFTAAGSLSGRIKIQIMEVSGFKVFHKWTPKGYLDFLKANGYEVTCGKTLASVSHRRKRRVLVFGAGVIGSYLAHVLCEAGNEVTILARRERVESLNRNGLIIRHHLQGKVTKDTVEAVTSVEGRVFDAAFVVMPYHKLKMALPEIVRLRAKLLVLVGNDVTPAEMEGYIKENAPGVKKILFGFQATAGKKEENRYICERLGGGMDIGQLHGGTDSRLKKWVQRMFDGTGYKLNWQGDMESYLICHLAAILPIGYLSYNCDGNLRKSTGEQRKMMIEASHEAYEFLKEKGITVYPVNDDKFFGKGIRGRAMGFLYFVMAKTQIGDLAACEHCRNAVSEMEQLDLFYGQLMEGYPAEKLKTWRKLRAQMPSWEELHRKYGN